MAAKDTDARMVITELNKRLNKAEDSAADLFKRVVTLETAHKDVSRLVSEAFEFLSDEISGQYGLSHLGAAFDAVSKRLNGK